MLAGGWNYRALWQGQNAIFELNRLKNADMQNA
jgi:hypothetical protein